VNRRKTRRLYREAGLAVRRRKSRRRIAVAPPSPLGPMARRWQPPIPLPDGPDSRWSVDFAHGQLACGRRFRVPNIIGDVTGECLAAVAGTSLSGKRVVREMTALIGRRGKPGVSASDNDEGDARTSSPRPRSAPLELDRFKPRF
jgi:putative transposase